MPPAPPAPPSPSPQRSRLDDLLARNLGTSRTAARRLLSEGRVAAMDGTPLTDPRAPPPPLTPLATAPLAADGDPPPPVASVFVDGTAVGLHERALVMQHKPLGVVTALRDARHATAYALLRGAPLAAELRPVGRLDLDTSGLLLWTTDGALIQRLTHPKRRVPRIYQAALARPFDRGRAAEAIAGGAGGGGLLLADGHRPRIAELRELPPGERHPALVLPAGGAAALATITVEGGAYHEVRRIFAALGNHVLALARTRFGEHLLPSDLAAGAWRPISAG